MDAEYSLPTPQRPDFQVMVESSDPFDLDQIASLYSGREKAIRLLFIAQASPSLAGPALSRALETIKSSTLDENLYKEAYSLYDQHYQSIEKGGNDVTNEMMLSWYETVKGGKKIEFDANWVNNTNREASSGLDKLQVELKGYSTNLIKESIRMGHRDLARFQYRTGDLTGAIRSYTKSREFCTTSHHVLEMCLGVIQVGLESLNYALVKNYVSKAESALEAIHLPALKSKKNNSGNLSGMLPPAPDAQEAAKERERLITLEKLRVAAGIANLGSGYFERAAIDFSSIGRETLDAGHTHFIPTADIALYTVLTGLATFDRSQVKIRLLENGNLRAMLDFEPWLREIIRAFYSNQFKAGFEMLDFYSSRYKLDLHANRHVAALLQQIRCRALLTFFTPFETVSIHRMAQAFGWDDDRLQSAVIDLIVAGRMNARVDSQAKVLVAKKIESRQLAFKNALKQGEEIQRRTKASQLRLKLIQADILVKPSKP